MKKRPSAYHEVCRPTLKLNLDNHGFDLRARPARSSHKLGRVKTYIVSSYLFFDALKLFLLYTPYTYFCLSFLFHLVFFSLSVTLSSIVFGTMRKATGMVGY